MCLRISALSFSVYACYHASIWTWVSLDMHAGALGSGRSEFPEQRAWGAMVLQISPAAADALRKRCVAKLPIVSEDLRASVTKQSAWKVDAWSGHTWVKLPRVAVGGADPIHTLRMGCTVCGQRFGAGWKWGNLLRHHKSQMHRAAVVRKIGLGPDALNSVPGAPSAHQFAQAWKELRAGAAHAGIDSAGCARGKVWRMLCCLAEAAFARDREFLMSEGILAALHRDEKNGRLQIDYTACNTKLETRAGTLGILDNQGGTFGIVATTKQVLERFWTDAQGNFDARGYDQFRHAVELLNVDAAPDEIAACREQSKPSAPELQSALTPNVRVIARDRAHGSQRLLARMTRSAHLRARPCARTLRSHSTRAAEAHLCAHARAIRSRGLGASREPRRMIR